MIFVTDPYLSCLLFSKIVSIRLLLVSLDLSSVENDAGDLKEAVGGRMTNFASTSRVLTEHVLWDLKANASRAQALVFKHDVANVYYKTRYSRHGVPAESTPIYDVVFNFSLNRIYGD